MRERVHLVRDRRGYIAKIFLSSSLQWLVLICAEAAEKCKADGRKTIGGEDILFAMKTLGFEHYGETLEIYLARYRMASLMWNLALRGDADIQQDQQDIDEHARKAFSVKP